jgi:hypothetical protein
MADYELIPGERGNVFIQGGFTYYKDKASHSKIYLRCKSNINGDGIYCNGRAVIDLSNNQLRVTRDHDHDANEQEVLVRDFKSKCKEAAINCVTGHMREAYNRIAEENPLGAIAVPFASIERQMSRWRRSVFPKNPRDIGEAIDCFERLSGK